MSSLSVTVLFFLIVSVAEGRSTVPPSNEVNLEKLFSDVKTTPSPNYEEECPSCPVCPTCPQDYIECHIMVTVDTPCTCSTCLTRCYARESVCPKGTVCTLEDVFYGNATLGQTAVCKPFKRCRALKCRNNCPESGFFVDFNGCKTCLCNDPCKELGCEVDKCFGSLTSPGTEPNYVCDDY